MSSFSGVNEDICGDAWFGIVHPAVESAWKNRFLNKLAGCVVVLKPTTPYEPKYKNAIADGNFGDLVLWRNEFGDCDQHDIVKYTAIARAKAFTSYLTGLPSHQVQQVMPSLYVPGMTKWGGSAVAGGGPMWLITAFSGVQWNFDQMIAEMMISAIQALCHEAMREVMESDEAMIVS